MELRPFWLVNAENSNDVFAVGLDLDGEAITYQRNPDTGAARFGRHASADDALRLYSASVNITLEWADAWLDTLMDWISTTVPNEFDAFMKSLPATINGR